MESLHRLTGLEAYLIMKSNNTSFNDVTTPNNLKGGGYRVRDTTLACTSQLETSLACSSFYPRSGARALVLGIQERNVDHGDVKGDDV